MRLNNKICINATDYAVRSYNCSLRVIRFWLDNAECSAQWGGSDNPEGRLIEVMVEGTTMKIGANDIFKVKRSKNLGFQQFFEIIMSVSYRSERRAPLQYAAPYWSLL